MQKWLVLLVATLALVACQERAPLDVKGMKSNVAAYVQEGVVVEGVVSTWQTTDPQLFAIVDVTEARNAEQFIVPVRYAGPLPRPGDRVRVTGKADLKRREFVATRIRVQ